MGDWGSLKSQSPSLDFLSLLTRRSGQPLYNMGSLAELDFSNATDIPSPQYDDNRKEDLCTDENVEQCIHYLNQELSSLGLPQVSSDHLCLINRLSDLLQQQQQHSRNKEELENRLHRLSSDSDYYKASNNRLKRDNDQLEKAMNQEKEKYRQLSNKYKTISSKLKEEKEEVRRLNSIILRRDLQSKHEIKKKERELMALKERLQKLIVEKTPCRKMDMDMPIRLLRSDGKRSTWKNVSSSKHEEEMYQNVIEDLEAKYQEMIVQNSEMKKCLVKMQKQLSVYLNEEHVLSNTSLSCNKNDHSFSTISEDEDSSCSSPRSSEQYDEHCHLTYDVKDLEKNVSQTCKLLRERLRLRKEKPDVKVAIEKNVPPIKRRHSSAGLQLSSSKNDEELATIKCQVELYKEIIQQQEELLRQSVQSAPHILAQSFANIEEKENLSTKHKELIEEKQKFLQEQKKITDATIRLAEEQAMFQSDKLKLLENGFPKTTSYRENSKNDTAKKDRLLPSTPSTGNTNPSLPKMPSSAELYRALGLTPK